MIGNRESGELGEGEAVHEAAFRVIEPAVLIEITAHIDNMHPKQVPTLIRPLFMVMDDSDIRHIKRQIIAMNSTGKVYVLRIHEIAFVKESCL